MIYITGDCHGNFERFNASIFPEQNEMTKDEYVIIWRRYCCGSRLLGFRRSVLKLIMIICIRVYDEVERSCFAPFLRI